VKSPSSGISALVGDWVAGTIGRLACWSFTRPWIALAVAGVLSAGAMVGMSQLRFSGDLVELLPDTFPSVRDIRALRDRFGGIGYVSVAAWNADPEVLKRFADEQAPKIAELDNILYVENQRPIRFLQDRRLYYLELEDVEEIYRRIKARYDWEKRQNNPLYISFEDEPDEPPSVDFKDIEAKYTRDVGGGWWRSMSGDYYLNEESRMIVLLAKPDRTSLDMTFAREITNNVQQYVDDLDLTQYDPDMKVALSGRYKKYMDREDRLNSDTRVASILALGLMLLYLGIHFRSGWSVLFTTGPLIAGLLWTFGLASVMFEYLNVLTGFLGAILLGLGIDHGIHLLERYGVERTSRRNAVDAVAETYRSTGLAVATAAITTMVAFGALSISEFRAFREFGILAAVGMVMVMLSFTMLMPALLGLAERRGWRPSSHAVEAGQRSIFARVLRIWSPALAWVGGVALVLLVGRMDKASFDYDFDSLEGLEMQSFQLDVEVNKIIGYSQIPVIILTENEGDERAVAEIIRERKQELGEDSSVDFVACIADLVPDQQDEKRKVLKKLNKIAKKIRKRQKTPDPKIEDLVAMTSTEPFTRETLPAGIRRQFQGPDEKSEDGFVLLFPNISLADGKAVRKFAQEVRAIDLGDDKAYSAAGEAMIMADIINMVQRETAPVFAVVLTAVLACCWLLLGGLRRAVQTLAPAVLTICALMGLTSLVGLRINYINMIILPVLLGIGVDGAVHLVTRLGEPGARLANVVAETGRAICGAVLTTALGFGALMIARHPGLDSLGRLAVVGLALNLLVILVFFTAFLAILRRRSKDDGDALWPRSSAPFSAEFIATVGFAGRSPMAPGTVGAFAALPVAMLLADSHIATKIVVVIAVFALGTWASQTYAAATGKADPQEVVVDELAGCLLALIFVPWSFGWALLAFVLFRFFDIVKPGPVRWAEKRLPGGWGIMGDDLVAGLFAGIFSGGIYYAGLSQGWWG